MNSEKINLEQKVMWRVYLIWLARYFYNWVFGKVVVLLFLFWASAHYISFITVWLNTRALEGWAGYYGFWHEAVSHTEGVVLFMAFWFLLTSVFLLRDFVSLGQRHFSRWSFRQRPLFNLF